MTDDFPITIYHDPDCAASRDALAMIEVSGYVPLIIPSQSVFWTLRSLRSLLEALNLRPPDLLRKDNASATAVRERCGGDDDAILSAMIADPALVDCPIVATPKGTKLCRPPQTVFTLLERKPAHFVKEDGEIVNF